MSDLVKRLRERAFQGRYNTEAAEELERLYKIEAAAKNLIDVKGRYHTEQAYKMLEDALK